MVLILFFRALSADRVLTRTAEFLKAPFLGHSCLPSIRARYEMSFMIIFHPFIVTVMTTKLMSPLALQMRHIHPAIHPAIAAFEGCIQVIRNWMHV